MLQIGLKDVIWLTVGESMHAHSDACRDGLLFRCLTILYQQTRDEGSWTLIPRLYILLLVSDIDIPLPDSAESRKNKNKNKNIEFFKHIPFCSDYMAHLLSKRAIRDFNDTDKWP